MQTKVVELDLNDVLPNRFQPRIKFSEESIEALADSIKEHGVIQPIVVRNIGDKYEIIAGERRYKASVLAGKQTIPAIITDLNEKDSAEVAIIENVQRKDLTPIEEAISYKKILDMGYLTQDSLALKLGKTQSTIANKLRLLNLDDDVQEALLNEKISERHARSLLKLPTHEKQRQLLQRIIDERLTVRKTDEEIDKMMNNNENNEMLNFGISTQPVEELTPVNNEPVETLEFFNPSLESLNIPTEPIVEDSIPEILPVVEPKPTTSFFNPEPEVINSTVPPISFDMFKEIEGPVEELNSNSIFMGNNPIEEHSTPLETTTNDFNNFESVNQNNMTDIFTEKPLAPLDNLLEPTPLTEVNPSLEPTNIETEDDESNEDILVPGKFFNLMPEEDEQKQEVTPLTSNFNFDFDVNSLNNIESTDNLPSLDNLPSFEINSLDTPVSNTTNMDELNTESLFSFNTLEDNNIDTNFNAPIVENSNNDFESSSETEIPAFDTFPTFEPEALPELHASNIEQPLEMPIEPMGNINNTKDVKNAINMIRELSENLNKMGYIVDLDEFDFENMYQVVFKINK